jgi:hypothetical protein
MATVTASYNWVSGETVTPAKLNSAAAPTVVVADNEVTTAKILDANVTAGKLAATLDLSGKTVTLPDDSVTNDKLSLSANAGEIKKALNADNDPPIFACRAWVNFDGTKDTTGATSTANTNRQIRASGNVTSVLRNGTGDYTVTFTTAMPDANYCVVFGCGFTQGTPGNQSMTVGSIREGTVPLAGSVRFTVNAANGSTNVADVAHGTVSIFR